MRTITEFIDNNKVRQTRMFDIFKRPGLSYRYVYIDNYNDLRDIMTAVDGEKEFKKMCDDYNIKPNNDIHVVIRPARPHSENIPRSLNIIMVTKVKDDTCFSISTHAPFDKTGETIDMTDINYTYFAKQDWVYVG